MRILVNCLQDHQGCQITGQTFTTDHHDDLVKMGITPSMKGMRASQKYPYVVFCAPPSRTPDYPGDVRYYQSPFHSSSYLLTFLQLVGIVCLCRLAFFYFGEELI